MTSGGTNQRPPNYSAVLLRVASGRATDVATVAPIAALSTTGTAPAWSASAPRPLGRTLAGFAGNFLATGLALTPGCTFGRSFARAVRPLPESVTRTASTTRLR